MPTPSSFEITRHFRANGAPRFIRDMIGRGASVPYICDRLIVDGRHLNIRDPAINGRDGCTVVNAVSACETLDWLDRTPPERRSSGACTMDVGLPFDYAADAIYPGKADISVVCENPLAYIRDGDALIYDIDGSKTRGDYYQRFLYGNVGLYPQLLCLTSQIDEMKLPHDERIDPSRLRVSEGVRLLKCPLTHLRLSRDETCIFDTVGYDACTEYDVNNIVSRIIDALENQSSRSASTVHISLMFVTNAEINMYASRLFWVAEKYASYFNRFQFIVANDVQRRMFHDTVCTERDRLS